MDKKTILAVGAHMDDCEIGAGGLIIKAVRKGHRVVLVNAASDYSTWCVTKGREKEVKEKVLKKAKEMGVEKRFLEYGYQSVPLNLEVVRKIAEIILEVRPDITLFHNQFDVYPPDHRTVGLISEYAVRDANTILGGKTVTYSHEMYAYEVMPCLQFQPDIFIDISDVIKEVVEIPGYFDRLYGEYSSSKKAGIPITRIKIDYLGNKEISLYTHGELKLITARLRGIQSGARYTEAYMSLDKSVIGKRILQEII